MNLAWAEPFRGRWNALPARERLALSVLGTVIGAALFYLLIWSPVHEGLAKARVRLSTAQVQLARVKEQAVQVSSLRNAPRITPPANLAAAVEQAAGRHGLGAQLKRIEAEGAGGVRAQFEGVPAAAVMAWLVELQQRSGLRAERATFERQTSPGTVNAQLVLRPQNP